MGLDLITFIGGWQEVATLMQEGRKDWKRELVTRVASVGEHKY